MEQLPVELRLHIFTLALQKARRLFYKKVKLRLERWTKWRLSRIESWSGRGCWILSYEKIPRKFKFLIKLVDDVLSYEWYTYAEDVHSKYTIKYFSHEGRRRDRLQFKILRECECCSMSQKFQCQRDDGNAIQYVDNNNHRYI